MTITGMVKAFIPNFICDECSHPALKSIQGVIVCYECGAQYHLQVFELDGAAIRYSYDRGGFSCMYNNSVLKCSESCPTSHMYCKTHCSEEEVGAIQADIKSMRIRAEYKQDKYDMMLSSRKTWAVIQLSGIEVIK